MNKKMMIKKKSQNFSISHRDPVVFEPVYV